MKKLLILGFILGFGVAFCVDKAKAETFKVDPITFQKNILPIFQTNCSGCHPGIVNYSVAFKQKDKILTKVTSIHKQMPPLYVSPRLSKGEIELIKAWVKNGGKQ